MSSTKPRSSRSRGKPDRGLVRSSIDVSNQRGEPVLTMKAMSLILLRNPGAAEATIGQAR